jgi:myosin heavy subunit
VGASIINYLLEKSRVGTQAEDERNYHVFYELVKGTSAEEKEKYLIDSDIESYYYLNQSGCIDIAAVDDVKNFESLKLALSVMSLATQDLEAIFKVISAILWLGNIEFAENSASDGVAGAICISNISEQHGRD